MRPVQQGRERVADPRVIGVQPRDVLGRQEVRVDQAAVDGGERQRLEAQHRPLAALGHARLLDQQQVLDADAEMAFAVVAGLVRQDHARLDGHVRALGQARRALVDAEVAAHPVPGAVVVVQACPPQRRPRQRVDLDALGPRREAQGGDLDHPAQHQRGAADVLRRGRADGQRAGDVGGAVAILAARIHEVEVAGLDRQVAVAADPVVGQGGVGAVAADRVEADVLQRARVAAKALQRLRRADLGDAPARHRLLQPLEEAHEGRAVALVGRARARLLGGGLAGLGQDAGIVGPDGLGQRLGHGQRRGGAGHADAALQRLQVGLEAVGLAQAHALAQMRAQRGVHAALLGVEVDRAVRVQHRHRERDGRMRHVRAAQVQ